MSLTALAEQPWMPDAVVRTGIRHLLRTRLRDEAQRYARDPDAAEHWLTAMRDAPVALHPEAANAQHYEVPAAFYRLVLGPHLKYSSAWWPEGVHTLPDAEAAMLALTCRRAGLQDGQDILELGCGWGSLSLWMAERYPRARITAVSNSASQGDAIRAMAAERGLANLTVVTADVNGFHTDQRFDRVVSVELFEHVRNWEALLARVHGWLRPGGHLFLHIFTHRQYAYPYEDRDGTDWMARHFFTGGMMPSADLPFRVRSPFTVARHWPVNGRHYARTLEAWLANQDARREAVLPVLAETYGADQARLWFQRWRIFFMACAELFAMHGGEEWFVSHYRLRRA